MSKLVSAKCPGCGASVQLPGNSDRGYCYFCGTQVIMDKERVEVFHQGSVSSLPLCPKCRNSLTEGNRIFKCDVCGEESCFICCRMNNMERQQFDTARRYGRRVQNADLYLCRRCARTRYVSCIGCDSSVNNRYSGAANGRCKKCGGKGVTGIMQKQCSACGGTGKCTACGGTGWVRLFQ